MTLPALARPDDRVTAWRWPLDLDAYDRDPALTPNERAALARRARFPHRFGHWTPLFHQELGRLARPVTDALDYLEIRHERARARVQCRLAQALYREESTYWAWPEGTWRSLLGTSRRSFNDRASTDRVSRGAFLAVGLVLKCAIVLDCLGKYERVPVAYRLFGHARVEAALDRVMQALVDWGYALPSRPSMRLTLCETFLFVQSPRLDDLTLDHLTRLRVATARHTRLRGGVLRLSRALAGLGVIPAPLNAWAYDESARLTPLTVSADRPNEAAAILPAWRALADRWRATTTLAPKTREIHHSQVLQVGRWATATYGDGADPACWTREMAAACVAMILQKRCGDWTPAATRRRLVEPGRPLQPRSQLHFLNAMCGFFRDCQEWEWMPRRLDAARAFAQPRSIRALIGPQPRVLSDDVWAKLLWAGLNVAEADLPPAWVSRHFYPLTMIRAVAVVWLFAGLRQDEIRRLRIGCIRFSPPASPPASEAVCLLDVPVNKTSTAFTKPVDRAVGEAIQAWEQERPTQPLALDEKTAELVHFLFSVRCARFSPHYLNRTLIPALPESRPAADRRSRSHYESPGALDDRDATLQRASTTVALRTAGVARSLHAAQHTALCTGHADEVGACLHRRRVLSTQSAHD